MSPKPKRSPERITLFHLLRGEPIDKLLNVIEDFLGGMKVDGKDSLREKYGYAPISIKNILNLAFGPMPLRVNLNGKMRRMVLSGDGDAMKKDDRLLVYTAGAGRLYLYQRHGPFRDEEDLKAFVAKKFPGHRVTESTAFRDALKAAYEKRRPLFEQMLCEIHEKPTLEQRTLIEAFIQNEALPTWKDFAADETGSSQTAV